MRCVPWGALLLLAAAGTGPAHAQDECAQCVNTVQERHLGMFFAVDGMSTAIQSLADCKAACAAETKCRAYSHHARIDNVLGNCFAGQPCCILFPRKPLGHDSFTVCDATADCSYGTADCPGPSTLCDEADQNCVDPTPTVGDWTCECRAPDTGSAVRMPADCAPATRSPANGCYESDTCDCSRQVCLAPDDASECYCSCCCPTTGSCLWHYNFVSSQVDECDDSAKKNFCEQYEHQACVDPTPNPSSTDDFRCWCVAPYAGYDSAVAMAECVVMTDVPLTGSPFNFSLTDGPTTTPTSAVPTTAAPSTPAPPTGMPQTMVPPTPHSPTAAPPTPEPSTEAPPTVVPGTPAPATLPPVTATTVPSTAPPPVAPPTTDSPAPTPPSPTPATLAPPTPFPTTPVPPTPSPTTPLPPATPSPTTPAPSTPSPTTPLPPATPSPTTPAPSTPSPATALPPATPSPTTPGPSTQSPTTPLPPATPSPTTPAPSTPSPATALPPATPSPMTTVPPTTAPATALPLATASPSAPASTTVPATAAPPTAPTALPPPSLQPSPAPPTSQPPLPTAAPAPSATSGPTVVPTATPAPESTAAPTGPSLPTRTPPTLQPPAATDVPRGAGPAPAATPAPPGWSTVPPSRIVPPADAVLAARLRSSVIRTGGAVLDFTLEGLRFAPRFHGRAVGVAVTAGDARVPNAAAQFGGALVTLATDKDTRALPHGLAGTLAAQPEGFVLAEVLSDGTTLRLTLAHADYYARSPHKEQLVVGFSGRLFEGDSPCGRVACEFALTIQDEHPTSRGRDVVEQRIAVASRTLAVVGTFSGSSAAVGLAKLAMASRAMLCPFSGPDKLDRTLNPLGLQLGDDKFHAYNGTVVGTFITAGGLLLLCKVYSLFVRWRVRRKYRLLVLGRGKYKVEGAVALKYDNVDAHVPPLNSTVVQARARYGWLVVPFGFIYGGACVGCMTAMVYSAPEFKVPAAFLFLIFVLGSLRYVWRVSTAAVTQCSYHIQLGHTGFKKFFWGNEEWAPDTRDNTKAAWAELNHLIYDGYLLKYRQFMVVEMVVMLTLGGLTAWQPQEDNGCFTRAWSMTAVLAANACLLLVCRPYIAPYEDIMEGGIVVIEVVMMVATLSAMHSDRPHDHWGISWMPPLAFTAMGVTFLKFVTDFVIFVIDEWDLWMGRGGDGSKLTFVQYWMYWKGQTSRTQGFQDFFAPWTDPLDVRTSLLCNDSQQSPFLGTPLSLGVSSDHADAEEVPALMLTAIGAPGVPVPPMPRRRGITVAALDVRRCASSPPAVPEGNPLSPEAAAAASPPLSVSPHPDASDIPDLLLTSFASARSRGSSQVREGRWRKGATLSTLSVAGVSPISSTASANGSPPRSRPRHELPAQRSRPTLLDEPISRSRHRSRAKRAG